MHRPVVHRRDPRLEILTEGIEDVIPRATPAYLTVTVTETLPGTANPDGTPHTNTWTGRPADLAQHQFTRLYGRPRSQEPRSPLAQAEDAKRRRDLGGEIGALMSAGNALESAPWYPCRRGDVVLLAYPAAGDFPAHGETYVIDDAGDGLMSMKLVAHSSPLAQDEQEGYVGCYATEAADCPINEAWFEAGPHLLTIVRDGRPVHVGGAR
ncbi:hypothetical protein [Streptomyces sp. NBC_00582]|uniref:hypothetical protein n=1 Tax=Streptomyces sp. NBC_00582 TaxID=2975783 RepID=UPI002E807632|nr:hypothetical protein [Streptomyces sp. NBC_00582]WUB61505.1 hypothetical protein OG852_14450 [Streptomyces sp. NBC_00582]